MSISDLAHWGRLCHGTTAAMPPAKSHNPEHGGGDGDYVEVDPRHDLRRAASHRGSI
jgi:hypothetical protein